MHARTFIDKITATANDYPETTFSRKGSVYTCVNPYSYHIVRKNWEIYNKMDGLYVDGIFMCRLIQLLWGRRIPRLSFDMSGMAPDLFARLNGNDESIYFVGAREEMIRSSIKNIQEAYPGMTIAGFRNGYFSSDDEKMQTIQDILDLNPDFVVVGMGSPLQEKFSLLLKEKGYKGIVFTCGGFLHQSAKNIIYYPEWIDKHNLRAIYRLFKERGLFKRLYNVLLEFPVLFGWDTFLSKHKKVNKSHDTSASQKAGLQSPPPH